MASRTCLDGGGPIRRARRAVPLADIAEETSDSMPSSIAGPLTDGVPVARGRARLATAVNVARTPGGGARNQATIRTTRGVMKPHQHGTGAPHAASSRFRLPLPCSFESLFRMGARSPFPLLRAHAHSVLQSLAGDPEASPAAAPVGPQSAFVVTLRLTCAHGHSASPARTVKAADQLRADHASHAPFFPQMEGGGRNCGKMQRASRQRQPEVAA